MSANTLPDRNRRHFVKAGLIGLAAAPFGNLAFWRSADAITRAVNADSTEIPKLPQNDEQALALAYTENAAMVDSKPDGASCSNCQLYSGSKGDQWGPCAIFSYRVDQKLRRNFVVSADGWCQAWGPRA